MNETLLACIKQVQEREFLFEIKQLKTGGCVPKKSKLRSLCPFLDQKGILREDNVPPAKWLLGKIIKKFPGPDNVTRVVSIKCKTGEYRRPVSKICILTK
ncbi:unnamed protein product [Euphydryas editha]|uniref:DUF5641 domain-containing protein n=1 Tax=Euphydryas editha TaxID=104508 RepID=A0AAU9ULM9_EUPED|nr:unnamed protein product [Euphydryas editha]